MFILRHLTVSMEAVCFWAVHPPHLLVCPFVQTNMVTMISYERLEQFLYKKLCYCRGTTRRTMLVSSCNVLRGVEVKKVSNSKSYLQAHSRALAMVQFDRPHDYLLVFHCNYVSILHCFWDIVTFLKQNLKTLRGSEHIPFGGNTSCLL